MRKIVAALYVSVDGVIESPEQWHFPYANAEFAEAIEAQMAGSDAMLLGRRLYEEWAEFWPKQGAELPMANYMNNTPKYVISTTLTGAEWQNSTVIGEHVGAEIATLKQQPGKNIAVAGSATLVWSLLRDGLLDELRLLLHPIVVGGAGKRLFDESDVRVPLSLVGSQLFSTGVLALTYVPAGGR